MADGQERVAATGYTARELRVGARVLVKRGYHKGERGIVTNNPGKAFYGWTVKLDNDSFTGLDASALVVES